MIYQLFLMLVSGIHGNEKNKLIRISLFFKIMDLSSSEAIYERRSLFSASTLLKTLLCLTIRRVSAALYEFIMEKMCLTRSN